MAILVKLNDTINKIEIGLNTSLNLSSQDS